MPVDEHPGPRGSYTISAQSKTPGAAPAFNPELGLVYRIEDERETIAFWERWLEAARC